MTADEARKLIKDSEARSKIKEVYEKIKKAAQKQETEITLGPYELCGIRQGILVHKGFTVERLYKDVSHHYEHSETTGWIVSWGKKK